MITDPIIEELHQVREQFAAQFNYDVFAIVAHCRARQEKSDRPVVSFASERAAVEEAGTEKPEETEETERDQRAA